MDLQPHGHARAAKRLRFSPEIRPQCHVQQPWRFQHGRTRPRGAGGNLSTERGHLCRKSRHGSERGGEDCHQQDARLCLHPDFGRLSLCLLSRLQHGRKLFRSETADHNLIWIHETLAFGETQQRWKDFNVFAYERLGAPNLLVGLNNDPNNAKTITVATAFGSDVSLHDYTGHSPDVVTDGSGSVTITIPRNQNGASYVCYSRQGFGGRTFPVVTHGVKQDFEGAEDLDIPPVTSGKTVDVGRIWSRANSPLDLVLKPDTTAFKLATPPGMALRTNARQPGFHTLRLTVAGAPASNPNPAFTLSATYTADPQL